MNPFSLRGMLGMSTFLIVNWILFLLVLGYGLYLFASLVYQRYTFIKLGKKAEWSQTNKERLEQVMINVFGQKKLLKDKKSGIIHVMMFYGFILVQFGHERRDFIVLHQIEHFGRPLEPEPVQHLKPRRLVELLNHVGHLFERQVKQELILMLTRQQLVLLGDVIRLELVHDFLELGASSVFQRLDDGQGDLVVRHHFNHTLTSSAKCISFLIPIFRLIETKKTRSSIRKRVTNLLDERFGYFERSE